MVPTDLVILLDSSTSVNQLNFKKMLNFVKQLLGTANIDSGDVRVGVLSYSNKARIHFNLNAHNKYRNIAQAVNNIRYVYGKTNTADAIRLMREEMFLSYHGDRPEVPNVCLIITDGVSSVNPERTIPEAIAARDEGIHIYAIGVGLSDTRELEAIATSPASDNMFNVQQFSELSSLANVIFADVCQGKSSQDDLPCYKSETSTVTSVISNCIYQIDEKYMDVNYLFSVKFKDIIFKRDI